MTPKEKSKELLRLIGDETSPDFEYLNIKLALICVYEIIKANPCKQVGLSNIVSDKQYWQQVKEELQKM